MITLLAEEPADGRFVAVRRQAETFYKESAMSSSVKQQVIEDLQMAGLSPGTQKLYLGLIVRFVNRTRIRPQDASEAQVAQYLRGLIQRGLCQGTIRPTKCALQFVFQNTLGRPWGLFKKKLPRRGASVCPRPLGMRSAAASSPPCAAPSIASVWP